MVEARSRSIAPHVDSVDDDVVAPPPVQEEVDIATMAKEEEKEVEKKVNDKKQQHPTTTSFVNGVVVDRDCRLHRHRHCSNPRRCQTHLEIHRQSTTDQRAIPGARGLASAHLAD